MTYLVSLVDGNKIELKEVIQPVAPATSAKASQELVLFNKPARSASATVPPSMISQDMVLVNKPTANREQGAAATPATLSTGGMSLVLSKPPATASSANPVGGVSVNGMMAPPGIAL